MSLPKILAICGSTKATSVNLLLIRSIATLQQGKCEVEIFDNIAAIPHFNPDLDNETPPASVADFRSKLRNADAILISTPEYAMGVPGTLKNAIDWTVSSCEFSKKPVALITASSLGEKAHASLLETLRIIEANVTDQSQLLISHVKVKVDSNGIKDPQTLGQVEAVMGALLKAVQLSAPSA